MSGFLKILTELFFRLKLFIVGIHFYQSKPGEGDSLIYEAEYRLDREHRIRFKFYSVNCKDTILRRGKLHVFKYRSYIVQAFLNNTFPDDMRFYDGKSFFFNGATNHFRRSEQETIELITDVYLDFLKTSLQESLELK